jgi:hypothetical protein
LAHTVEELQADHDAIYAARLTFLTTGAVRQVTRAGRTLIRDNPTLAQLDAALLWTDNEILRLNCLGTRRRRAFTMRYGT